MFAPSPAEEPATDATPLDLSYCVVNNDGREYLLDCLAAIERFHPAELTREVLVLDNASSDGSVEAVAERFPEARVIALEAKQGKAANDTLLMETAAGRYCLLLNEDSELRAGAVDALFAALENDAEAGAAGAQLFDGDGNPYACAWRFPGVEAAVVGALFLHSRLTVQSQGELTRRVDWAQSSALMVRRDAAAEIDYMDPQFFVYYDECDFCKRLSDAGWHTLYVPAAEAVHHNQLSTDLSSGLPRIVEFHRNRDLYMRKHHGRVTALAVRVLTAWAYGLRTIASVFMPAAPTDVYAAHTRQALFPYRGESLADRAKSPQNPKTNPN
ncbi:MAG: glycosyltransferase family 2 protein [Solirubrobacterales bacterium]|nr:glycosyltransferase family 2 protein [Solirubrobacterales bacterium]